MVNGTSLNEERMNETLERKRKRKRVNMVNELVDDQVMGQR